jgi:hypothetical protein
MVNTSLGRLPNIRDAPASAEKFNANEMSSLSNAFRDKTSEFAASMHSNCTIIGTQNVDNYNPSASLAASQGTWKPWHVPENKQL